MTRYPRALRLAVAGAVVSILAACTVKRPAPPRPAGPGSHEAAVDRLHQVDGRIESLSHRIDTRVDQGYYPPPQGGALHHRLETIHSEAHDMAAQHGGGISVDEQHVLNQELDTAARAIGE
ncbi:hypothetical protein [Paraburkholderia lycopersici]|uniref:Lipoprotein n=1 Tax=Paraburkholderia lycopersici TaxID=416944 RepID=A0A1G6U8F8_9BURK|nr:hypothetical protein [Paraburkholderia lycopersici]SDD37593.1 hypothetical protein SAMN05421548_118110 [Paraburkholderia lycopersici]